MKIIRQICLFLCIILCAQSVVFSAAAEQENTSVTQGCRGIDSAMPFLGSEYKIPNAEAIVLYETTTQTLMYTWNPDAPIYPASLTKIMTALIAVEAATADEPVTVKGSTVSALPPDAASSNLLADEILTMEQLIYCLLVDSANDAAAVIADHIGGSQAGFVKRMNDRAQELGCTNTKFVNPHGLHHDEQITTARDMARILEAAMKNERFAEYFGTTHYVMEQTNKSQSRSMTSSNHMMHKDTYEIYYDERVIGGRTGVNNSGLNCLATAATDGDLQLLCIVSGSQSSFLEGSYYVSRIGAYGETEQLLDMGFDGYKTAQIFYEGQVLCQLPVTGGTSDVMIGPDISVSSVLPVSATMENLDYRFSNIQQITGPVEKGTPISYVEVWIGKVCIASAQLYAMNSVGTQRIVPEQGSGNPSGNGFVVVLIVLLVLGAVLFITLLTIRLINRRKASASGRSYRKNRRRSR